jgi:hypothetical protein
MKKILYLTHKPIFPIKDGGTRAMALFLDALTMGENLEITYMPMVTPKHAKADLPSSTQVVRTVPLIISTIKGLKPVQRIIAGVPLNVLRYLDGSSAEFLRNFLHQNDIDIIICDGFYALCLLGKVDFEKHQVVYRSHNVETNYWRHRARYDTWWKRPLFRWIARRMRPYEEAKVALANEVLSISADEMPELITWNPRTQLFLPHVSMDYRPKTTSGLKNSIGFIGDMHWFPNKRALNQFTANIWPCFHEKFPQVQLTIAGKGSETFTDRSLAIVGMGFVSNLEEFIERQRFLINPITEGTGFNMKLLDALRYQVPLISYQTRLGGLPNVTCFLSSKNDDDFLKHMERLILNEREMHEIIAKIPEEAARHFNEIDRAHQLQIVLHGS